MKMRKPRDKKIVFYKMKNYMPISKFIYHTLIAVPVLLFDHKLLYPMWWLTPRQFRAPRLNNTM